MEIQAGAFSETIVGLVVGVSRCADSNLPALTAIEAETPRLAEVLISPNACRIPASQVTCLTTAAETTREQILSALHRLCDNGRPNGILFFFLRDTELSKAIHSHLYLPME